MIKKFKGRKVYAKFKDNTSAEELAEIRSLSSKNEGVKFLLYVVDAFTKYAWIKPMEDK